MTGEPETPDREADGDRGGNHPFMEQWGSCDENRQSRENCDRGFLLGWEVNLQEFSNNA